MQYYIPYFAQAYGEGNYGANTYSCTQAQINAGTCVAGASTGGGTGTGAGGAGSGAGGSGSLANTGFGLIAIITLACLIMFAAMIVRVWRRPKPAVQEAETYTPQPSEDADQPRDAQTQ